MLGSLSDVGGMACGLTLKTTPPIVSRASA
jgi:hypothetical protein